MKMDKVGIWVEHDKITLVKVAEDSRLGQALRKRKTIQLPLASISRKEAEALGLLLIRNSGGGR